MRQRGREPHSQFQQNFCRPVEKFVKLCGQNCPAMLQGQAWLQGLSAGNLTFRVRGRIAAAIVRTSEAGPGSCPLRFSI